MSEVKVNKISPRSGTTVTLGDSGDTFTLASGVSLTGVNATFSGDLTVDTNTLYVDSANNRVGIGTSSPSTSLTLDIGTNNVGLYQNSSDATSGISLADNGGSINLATTSSGAFRVLVGGDANTSADNSSEAMRIDSSGNVLVGKTAIALATVGGELRADGQITGTKNGGSPLILNRTTSDGEIAQFYKDATKVGSIGAGDNDLYIGKTDGGTDCYLRFGFSNSQIIPASSSGGTNDNTLDLGAPTSRFNDLYMGGNIYLGGTGSANALDDYEEGTWTPTISGSSVTNVGASSYNKYTKIGDTVFITGYIEFNTTPTENAPINIGGLPFTCNVSVGSGNFIARYFTSIPSAIYVPSPATNFEFYGNTQTGNWRQIKYNDMGGASAFHYSFHYKTNS